MLPKKHCPRCGRPQLDFVQVRNALSRKDHATYICTSCGTDEAMINYQDGPMADVWPGYPGYTTRYSNSGGCANIPD